MLRTLRRATGALLIGLVVVPFYRLLERPEAGLAGRTTAELSALHSQLLWSGSALIALIGVLAAVFLRADPLEARITRAGAWLLRPRTPAFAALLACVAGAATFAFSSEILRGKPNLIDAISQLLHARYVAAGYLAGPTSHLAPFWHIQNTILTPSGWVSQYPPGHVVLLAAGFRLGAVWVVGPALMATTVFFTCLAAERLLPERPAIARLGAVLTAVSPFLIGLAGAYMNHITAAAFTSAGVYFALRARDGHAAWAAATGAAFGAALATRPLSALAIGAAATLGAWAGPTRRAGIQWGAARLAALAVGAAPLLVALGAYNAHFFGGPFRFGYDVALGPAVRPGFHQDPWGNTYGPLQALAYTSSDLTALSLYLLETPLPAVPLVGLFLLTTPRLATGERILAAWGLAPVAANALYWHHGLFMGPRMLNEAAPAWGLFTAAAAVHLVRCTPIAVLVRGRALSPRAGAIVVLVGAGLTGACYLAPQRLASYAHFMPSMRVARPRLPAPTLVFVHGGWTGRIAMRLAGQGMRLDSVETALRQNSACELEGWLSHAELSIKDDATSFTPKADFLTRPGVAVPEVNFPGGNAVRVRAGERFQSACARQLAADRFGIVDLAPLIWQGNLPGLSGRGAMFVRDLGPELNAALLARFPGRQPFVLMRPGTNAAPVLVRYDAAMNLLWPPTEAIRAAPPTRHDAP